MFSAGGGNGHALLRWGGPTGPILAAFDLADDSGQPPVTLESLLARWDGAIRIGGFVERLHMLTFADTELAVIEIVGGAHTADHVPLASLEEMQHGIYEHPADAELIGERLPYPFILESESAFVALAQDAMVAGLAVDAVGRLAGDDQGLQIVCGLPLRMVNLTLHR
jgi:hypothetical protein